jgi:hypothetical protein
MKITIAQYYTENLTHGKYAEAINRNYCEQKGYSYFVEKDSEKIRNILDGRAPTWYKPKLILEIFENLDTEYVLFLDTDAIISDFSENIESFIDENFNFIGAEDASSHSVMNAGVFLIKNNAWSVNLLNLWWNLSTNLKPSLFDRLQVAENQKENENYFTNGLWMDQSVLTYIYLNYEKFREKIKIISSRSFNHGEYNQNNFIFHAYKYGGVKNRTLDVVHNKIFNIPIPTDKEIINIIDYYVTDKHYEHNYFNLVYNDLFKSNPDNVKKFLDIGGIDVNILGLWKDYFKNAQILAVNKNFSNYQSIINNLKDERIKFLDLDISDDFILSKICDENNNLDIVLDDGSHKMKDQQYCFAKLFKNLNDNGIYIIEDLHTSLEAKIPEKESFGWGDPKKTTTLEFLENFIKNGKFESDYLSYEDLQYLNETVENVQIYRNSPNWSITSVIRKKNKITSHEPIIIPKEQTDTFDDTFKEKTSDSVISNLQFNENFDKKIFVVYHCHLVNDWKFLVREQLVRLYNSGLYHTADKIFVTVNLENENQKDFENFISDFDKLEIEFFNINDAEYPGIKKVRDLGFSEDCYILYFHTKGVSNIYNNFSNKNVSFEKIHNVGSWRKCLEYFLVDRWEECIDKLVEYDNVGVTCVNGWFWGNFWWTQSKHIRKTKQIGKGSRWLCESWLNEGTNSRNFEWYHFEFNGHLTFIHPDWYEKKYVNNPKKIILRKAIYGTPPFEIDEGYSGIKISETKDVTEIVSNLLKEENNEEFNININNIILGGDPSYMSRKFLFLEFTSDIEPHKIYNIGVAENTNFNFKL